MRADIHDGPEHMLQSEAGYIDARPLTPARQNLLQRTAGPYIRVMSGSGGPYSIASSARAGNEGQFGCPRPAPAPCQFTRYHSGDSLIASALRPHRTQTGFMQCSNSIFCAFQAGRLPAQHVTVSVSKTLA